MEVGRVQPVANHLNRTNDSSTFSDSYKQKEQKIEEMPERKEKLTEKEVKQAVDGLNQMFDISQTHIRFMFHEKLGEYYVQVIDDRKNEVIREIPSRKILDVVASIQETIGIVFDEKV